MRRRLSLGRHWSSWKWYIDSQNKLLKKVVTLLQACLLTFSNTLSDNDGRKRRLPVGLYGLESSTLLCLSKESHPWPILVKLSDNNEWKQHHLESWKVIDFMNVTLVIYFVEPKSFLEKFRDVKVQDREKQSCHLAECKFFVDFGLAYHAYEYHFT